MRTKEFLGKLEHRRIVRAIATAEATTSGEIRVFIQRGVVADVVSDARAQFERLGMTQTRERNAILRRCGDVTTVWRPYRFDDFLRPRNYRELLCCHVEHSQYRCSVADPFPDHHGIPVR
jgi:hypothetical protein